MAATKIVLRARPSSSIPSLSFEDEDENENDDEEELKNLSKKQEVGG